MNHGYGGGGVPETDRTGKEIFGRYRATANPFFSIRLRSFRDGPPGFFSPISHFCTVDTLVLSTAANTAWLTCSRSRRERISPGVISGTERFRRASNSSMRRLSINPIRCKPRAVSCISSRIRLSRFLVVITDLLKFSGQKGFFQLPVVKFQEVLCDFLKESQSGRVDIGPFIFAEPVQKEPAVFPFGRNDHPRAAAFAPPGKPRALLEHLAPEVGIDQSPVHFGNGVPKDGVRDARLSTPSQKGPGDEDAFHERSISLSDRDEKTRNDRSFRVGKTEFFAGFAVLEALALLIDQGFSVMVAGITAGLLTTAAWKAFHLVVWFPDHVLRWIGSSGSPMGTEGESRILHGTVVGGVGSLSPIAEKGMGKVGKGATGSSGKNLAPPPHPGDTPVQGQGN